MENGSVDKAISLIEEALYLQVSINKLCVDRGIARNYVPNVVYDINKRKKEGTITQEKYKEFFSVYDKYLEKKNNFPKSSKTEEETKEEELFLVKPTETKVEEEYDAYQDDKYDDRSVGEAVRSEDEYVTDYKGNKSRKIISYKYRILVRDEDALEGELDRDEMNMVYRLYSNLDGAGLNQRAVSRHFSHLTFRDFKRILRAFNITKQSIPVAPHIIEEESEEEVMGIIFRNKETNILNKLEEERGKYTEKLLKQAQKELVEIKSQFSNCKNLFDGMTLEGVEPFEIEKKSIDKERALAVYISDQHVGAHTESDSIYENEYNEVEFNNRLKKTIEVIQEQFALYGRFDSLIIFNLGDCLDGYDGFTTRGGHKLPQNMNNKEQFQCYISGMVRFFDTIHNLDMANNIEFQSVTNDNHSGDFGWMANKALETYLEMKYPDMTINVFANFINHFEYGNHTFIVSHGKDDKDKKFGLPLVVDGKTEGYINEYIDFNNISNKALHFVSGDLHQSATTFAKRFRYKKVLSMYGASRWIHTNFGNTKPGVDYDIVDKNGDMNSVREGRLYFL